MELKECNNIKIFHLETIPELRNFVKAGLERQKQFKIIGSSGNYHSALESLKETTPDILIYSLDWDDESLSHLKAFKQLVPSIKIIVLSMSEAETNAAQVKDNGLIDAFIGKHQCSLDLYDCIRELADKKNLPFSEN